MKFDYHQVFKIDAKHYCGNNLDGENLLYGASILWGEMSSSNDWRQ